MDDGVRASDADRDGAAAQLQVHFALGGLDSPGVLPAWAVPGAPVLADALETGGPGALCGALIGATGAVALSRPSRRFRMT